MSPSEPIAGLPDPGQAHTLDELIARLRLLKVWAGDPSYEAIKGRVNVAWNTDLMIAIVQALRPDAGYAAQWRQALRVVLGETQASLQVRTQDALPTDLTVFTGRTTELDRLRQVPRRSASGDPIVISAIEGMAGVGKTQLAIHAGHLLAREQPFDRVLFVNLRGFHPDPTQPPADPAAVLDGFLRLLGVPGQQIPHDVNARAARYRQQLAGKRALVVLDNAADESQVQPLLPGSPDCITLITSRRSLARLRPAMRLTVDVFTPEKSVDFLARAAPDVSIGDDPNARARVAQRCGHLPLALGLVAGHMRAKPGWTVTDHADWLDERHRDRKLDTGVELTLSLSYQQLPAERQRLFRLLALHPGHDIDTYAATALTNTALNTAGDHLHQLCSDHLLQQGTSGRFVFHDLVRVFATDRATDEDRPSVRRAALSRLFDHYLHTAAVAMDTLFPAEQHRRPRIPPPNTPTPSMADPSTAHTWLDAERTNLTAAAIYAATHGWDHHTTRLSTTLSRHLDSGGHYSDAVTLHTHAQHAAHRTSDRTAEGHALTNLGVACARQGRFQQSIDHLQQALALFRELGDRLGEARALNNLGFGYERLGRYQQAADHHQQALALFRELGDRLGEARTLGNLGFGYERLGRYQQAADHHQQALALFREIRDGSGEAVALGNLGIAYQRQGHHQQATDHLQQALTLSREIRDRPGEANALTDLGIAYQRQGHHQQATDHLQQALTLSRELGETGSETEALNGLGEASLANGNPDQAHTHHATALNLATQIGHRREQARAHNGLARTHHTTGAPDQARQHWQHALTLYTELNAPEADQVRAHLAALDNPFAR